MKPIGLTMKKSRNKYRLESRGELMLIHECTECRTLSINRIAADDHPESILEVFNESHVLDHQTRATCKGQGILILDDMEKVYTQLYGQTIKTSILL